MKVYLADTVRNETRSMEFEERRELLQALRSELTDPERSNGFNPGHNDYGSCDVLGYRCTYRTCHADECAQLGVKAAYMILDIQELATLAADGLASA